MTLKITILILVYFFKYTYDYKQYNNTYSQIIVYLYNNQINFFGNVNGINSMFTINQWSYNDSKSIY